MASIYAGKTSSQPSIAQAYMDLNKPSGTALNELLLAVIQTNGMGISLIPPGWSEIGTQIHDCYIYQKIVSSEEPASYRWTRSGTNAGWAGVLMRWRGGANVSPIQTFARSDQAGNDPALAPSVTTTRSSTTLVFVYGSMNENLPAPHSDIFPGSMTQIHTAEQETNPYGFALAVGYEHQGAKGASGTRSWTPYSSGDVQENLDFQECSTIALEPTNRAATQGVVAI